MFHLAKSVGTRNKIRSKGSKLAALIFLQIDFRRTHDLNILRDLLPDGWQLKTALPNLDDLNKWAVEARYPEKMQEATKAEASKAVEQARTVWTSVSTALAQQH